MPPRRTALAATVVSVVITLLLGPDPARASEPGPGPHSSDGRSGRLLVPAATPDGRLQRTVMQRWDVAPGVGYRQWTQTLPQGEVRMHLLRVELSQPGLTLDTAAAATATRRVPVSRLVSARRAVAGVNGDFFDIHGTGAPLGVGRERARGLRHGPRTAVSSCLRIDARGTPRIGPSRVAGTVTYRGRRLLSLDGLNSPTVRGHRAVLYTPGWGRRPAAQVLGAATRARQVGVAGGVVRWTTARPRSGPPIRGRVLLGRGRAADALARLRVGERVRLTTTSTRPGAQAEVCGSTRLLRGGRLTGVDRRWLHPRTAVGIDRDARRLFLLVADGRSRRSAGLTLHQLAGQLRALGSDEALNLDGGGSSTMVAPDARGRTGVRNQPSDGRERRVPNALVVRSTR